MNIKLKYIKFKYNTLNFFIYIILFFYSKKFLIKIRLVIVNLRIYLTLNPINHLAFYNSFLI